MTTTNPNPQMLLVEPKDELKIYGMYDPAHPPQAKIKLTNPTPYSIHFKIKTTAAQRYWVTPKMGILLPNSEETIIIGMKGPNGDTQDKFKLLAIVSPNTGKPPQNVWENFDESQAMTTKWVVVFADEREGEMTSVPTAHSVKKEMIPRETIPSIAKILTFIIVGFVAVASSLYRLGTR